SGPARAAAQARNADGDVALRAAEAQVHPAHVRQPADAIGHDQPEALADRKDVQARHRRAFSVAVSTAARAAAATASAPCATDAVIQLPLAANTRSEEHTSELQSREKLVCRLLPEKKKADALRSIT